MLLFLDPRHQLYLVVFRWYLKCISKLLKKKSFFEGRALCQLISYYQPHLLVAADIRQDTTHNMRAPTGDEDSSISSSHSANGALLYFSPGKRSNSQLTAEQKAIANERANFDLIHRAIKELGGVPMLGKGIKVIKCILIFFPPFY